MPYAAAGREAALYFKKLAGRALFKIGPRGTKAAF